MGECKQCGIVLSVGEFCSEACESLFNDLKIIKKGDIDKIDYALTQSKKIIIQLQAENRRLKEGHCDIYEVYAGSENMIAETAPERYWIDNCKEMADIAGKLKGK